MNKNAEKEAKVCWYCNRILVGNSILGLCPKCIDDFSKASLSIAGLTFIGRQLVKNWRPILKFGLDFKKKL